MFSISKRRSPNSPQVLLIGLLCTLGAQASLVPTEEQSFSLRTSIQLTQNDGFKRIVRLHESYSREQQRATFKYQLILRSPISADSLLDYPSIEEELADELTKSEMLYLDASESNGQPPRVLQVDEQGADCHLLTVELLLRQLSLYDFIPEDSQMADQLVVGAARFLFLYKSQLQPSKSDRVMNVRNVPCSMYEIDYKNDNHEDIHLVVLYAQHALDQDQQANPVQIAFTRSNGDFLVIDYGHLQLLPNGIVPTRQSSGVQLDEFAVEPKFGCLGKLVSAGQEVHPFEALDGERSRFTFSADHEFFQINRAFYDKRKLFVAYDARLRSMRVDSLMVQSSSAQHQKMEVFNFELNRRYDISKRLVDSLRDWSLSEQSSQGESNSVFPCQSGRIDNIGGTEERAKYRSIDELLVGASRFVYLGRASVRGMGAKLFEAHGELTMPYWLDQPVPVRFKDNMEEFQRVECEFQDKPTNYPARKLSVLLYVADRPNTKLPIPVKLDIFERNQEGTETYSHQSISIYSFAWHLGANGLFEERAGELFSLGDLCTAGLVTNQFALVQLLLEADDRAASNLLSVNPPTALERNSALLGALQKRLRLPGNLVFDFQSRSLVSTQKLVDVSFRVADHLTHFVQPIYLGRGVPNRSYTGRKLDTQERTFHDCLMLAARRRSSVYFGYNTLVHNCLIDLEPVATPLGDLQTSSVGGEAATPEWPKSFSPGEQFTMEIFKTQHMFDESQKRTSSWIVGNANAKTKLNLLGAIVRLLDYPESKDSQFIIKRIHVEEGDLFSSSLTGESASMDASTADRLVGFGLMNEAKGNKMVSADALASDRWTGVDSNSNSGKSTQTTERQMTFDVCQAACMSDQDCQSFSVCIRVGRLECIISTVDFRSPDIREQLKQQLNKSTTSSRLQLEVGGLQVELLRNRLCTIHIKRYLEMFSATEKVNQVINGRVLRQVSDAEDCARLCVKKTLKLLREDIAGVGKSLSMIGEDVETREMGEFVAAADKHRELASQFCHSILYIERENVSPELETQLNAQLLESQVDSTPFNGYCLLGGRASKSEMNTFREQNLGSNVKPIVLMDSRMFEFKTELLYERQAGVYLEASKMSAEEYKIYLLLKQNRADLMEDSDWRMMRKFIAECENAQKITASHPAKCALNCFAQSLGPWPACRSFDVIVRLLDNAKSFECRLNSLTLAQVIENNRSELIRTGADDYGGKDTQVWHYEPRTGLTLEESLLSANLELGEDSQRHKRILVASSSYRLHWFGAVMLVLLGTVSGLVAALQFGSKAIELLVPTGRRRDSEDQDKELYNLPSI